MSEFEIVDVTEGDRLMSQKEAAARLGTNQAFIKRLLDTGLLPCIRFGRYARISVNEQLKNAPGTASRAGRISAILFARHADIFAKAMRENGAADYTALDYLKQHQVVFNQDLNGGMNQESIESITSRWIENINKMASGEKVDGAIDIMKMPPVYELITLPNGKKIENGVPLQINKKVLMKVLAKKRTRTSRGHGFEVDFEILSQIPQKISDPIMILKNRTSDGEIIPNDVIAVLDLKDKNGNIIIVPMALKRTNGRYKIKSIFPKNSSEWFVNRIKEGDLLYVNKTKATSEMKLTEHQSPPRSFTDGFVTSIIPTEEDLVKLKNKNIFNQMAGERAAANLDIGQAGLLAKLREAQSMNDTVEEIYRQTGWVLGADGKWRFEIPDNLDAVDYGVLHENGEAKLSEVYDNPKLYMAYPQLRDIPVMMDNDMENSAGSTNGLRIRLAPKAGKTTLLHEIKHIIQRYENFASGGSPDSVINRIEDRVYSLKKTIEGGFKSDTGDVFRLLEDYDNAKQGMVRAMRSRKRGEAAQLKGLMQELKGKIADSCRNPKDVDSIISAYLFARHADIFAKAMRENGAADYTALDYLKQHQVVFNQDLDSGMNQMDKTISISSGKFRANSGKEALKSALSWFKDTYPDGVNVDTLIGSVHISRSSIKDTLSHGFSQKKLDVIPTLAEGIQSATLMQSIPDYNPNKRLTYHYLVYSVYIDNEENFALCRIKDDGNVKKLYVHEVASREEIQKTSDTLHARTGGQTDHEYTRGIALYNSILADYVKKVDSQTEIIFNPNCNNKLNTRRTFMQ